jgi:hypothetical protein
MLRKLRMNEARELGHVELFEKLAMEEGVLYVNLSNGPTGGDG